MKSDVEHEQPPAGCPHLRQNRRPLCRERPLASCKQSSSLCGNAAAAAMAAHVVLGSFSGEGLAFGAERAGLKFQLSPPLPAGACSLANQPTFFEPQFLLPGMEIIKHSS